MVGFIKKMFGHEESMNRVKYNYGKRIYKQQS